MSNISKIIVITASIIAIGYTTFDFFFASKGDQNLSQYDTLEVSPTFDTSIFDFLAKSSGEIHVKEEEIAE